MHTFMWLIAGLSLACYVAAQWRSCAAGNAQLHEYSGRSVPTGRLSLARRNQVHYPRTGTFSKKLNFHP